MKLTYILGLIVMLAITCMGADKKLELNLHQAILKELPENLKSILDEMKRSVILYESSNSKKVDAYLSLIDVNKTPILFRSINSSRDKISKLLLKNHELKVYQEMFGFPLGRKPSYVGHLLYVTWNLAVNSVGGEDREFIRVIGFFKPQKNKPASNFMLVGFILLDSKSSKVAESK